MRRLLTAEPSSVVVDDAIVPDIAIARVGVLAMQERVCIQNVGVLTTREIRSLLRTLSQLNALAHEILQRTVLENSWGYPLGPDG